MLASCDSPLFLPRDKYFAPSDNKVWYSQNEKEDYPNIEMALTTELPGYEQAYIGYITYKKGKIDIEVSLFVATRDIEFTKPYERSIAEYAFVISYKYNYKKNYIELKKEKIQNPTKFGFDFTDYLPFNLYIKDFNKDEWLAKYPEDKEAKENPNEEKQSNL